HAPTLYLEDQQPEHVRTVLIHRQSADFDSESRSYVAPKETLHGIARNSEREIIGDHAVDPDNASFCVGEHSTGIARRESNVRPDPVFATRMDNPDGKRSHETERIAHGKHQFANP